MRALPPIAAAAFALAVACGDGPGEPTVVRVFEPYAGEAYPDKRPRFTLPPGEMGLVSNFGSDTVSLVDVAGLSVVGNGPVGRDPVSLDGPRRIVGDRARGVAYVILAYPPPPLTSGPHAAEHAARTRLGYVQKLALDDLRPLGEARVQPFPFDLAMSDDGARLVVSHFDLELAESPSSEVDAKRADLALMAGDDLVPQGGRDPVLVPRVCVAPSGVALSPGAGATAYVACYGEDVLAIVDLDAPEHPVVRIPLGTTPSFPGNPVFGPRTAVRSPSGTLLATSNVVSGDVRVFDVAPRAFRAPIAVDGAPQFAAWSADERTLYVPTRGPDALVVVDVASGAVTRTIELPGCTNPQEAVFASDRSTLFVVCEGDGEAPGRLIGLHPDTFEAKANLTVGVGPDRLFLAR